MRETTAVLKTDVLGRVRISREHREALLDAFENGGTSGLAFARSHGVNLSDLRLLDPETAAGA